ncbi:MAG: putative Ig domain-containing protein, partial [Nitrospira sp.]|nr:putative Ig domain-containing protein [Nitrospira sp.]
MRDTLYFSKLRVFLAGWRWRLQRFRPSQWRRWQRTHRTICSPRSASLFTLEPLESRLLLAADLTGVVQSSAQIDPAVPGNAASAVVQVQNIGNQRANATTQVGVYASLDATLGAGDVLLGSANTAGLNAGQSRNVTVNFTVPSGLTPSSYTLLAKVDNGNAIAENSEANNISARSTPFSVTWQFGNVPGRAGNTTLTLRDADGTMVTFGLSGPGRGEVIQDGVAWDLKLTGTTASSDFIILTDRGGNDRVTVNDIHVHGSIRSVQALTVDLTGTLAIDGPVSTLSLGSATGAVIAAPSVQTFVAQTLVNTNVFIGAVLGEDGKLGGTGVNADSFGAGRIGLFVLTGSMSGTTVRVGVDPVDGVFGNGNDVILGGTASSIGTIVSFGSLSADSRFLAGSFPSRYSTGLFSSRPTAGDPHFSTDPNTGSPTLSAVLLQDTGSSNNDRYTNNPAITGSVNDPQGIVTFTAGFGAIPTVNVLSDRQSDGSFTFSRARLEQINGGPLTDGPHTLTLRATDTVGNSTQIAVSLTLDTTIATLTVDLAPAFDTPPVGDQQTTQSTISVIGQTESNALIELIGLGLTGTADGSGNFTLSNVALALGANSFTVRATDAAGNQRTETRTFTRLAPSNQAPVLTSIGSKSVAEGLPLDFTATANEPDAGQTLTFSVENGTSGAVPVDATINPTSGAFSWTPTEAQGPGTYTFDVVVTDNGAPTLSDRETITVTVGEVNQAPTLDPIGTQTVTASQLLSFTAVGSDGDVPANTLTYSLQGTVPAGASINSTTGAFSWTPTAAQIGPQSVTVRVTDNGTPALFAEQVVSITVAAIPNQAPVLATIGNQTIDEGQALTLTATATDPNAGQTRTFSLENGTSGAIPAGAGINPTTGAFSWTPTEGQGPGTFTFDVVVTDNGAPILSDRETITVTVNEVNQAPTLSTIGNQTVNEGALLTFTATATDGDVPADTLTYSLQGTVPAGASINPTTGAFTWTPTAAQIGPHSLTIRVTDTGSPAQFDEETLTVTVGEVNEAPTLTAIGPQTIDEGQLLTFTATASEPDAGQTLTFSFANGTSGQVPAGATINPATGAFSWTPTELQGPGTYTFDVVVTDNGAPTLSDRETIVVTVNEVNQAPTLEPITAQTVTAGQLLSFAAVGSDPDVPANTLTYSLQGTVPAGASINPTTGAFTWTPTVAQIGPQSVTVRVTDNGTPAFFAEQVVSITVAAVPNQAPVLSLIGNQTISEHLPFTFTATANDPDAGQTLTFSLAPGASGAVPAGATINPTTGAFSWAPTELQGPGTYTFDVVVTDNGSPTSSDRETITVTVTEANAAPVLLVSSVPIGQVDSPLTPVGAVGRLVRDIVKLAPGSGPGTFNVSDSDAGAVTGIAISTSVGLPLWYSLDNGTTWVGFSPSASNVRLLAADASTRLYVSPPSIDFAGTRVNEFMFQAWDRTVGTNGGVITTGTLTGTGPTGAFSSGFAQATVVFIEDQVTNQAPVLAAIGNQTVGEGQALTLTATASDPNAGQTLTFSLANGTSGQVPAGATINPASGAFSWTPTELQGPGTYTFDVVVTDNGAPTLSDRETITVTVNEVNQAPTLTTIGNQAVNEGALLTFTATATDGDVPANTLTYSLQGTVPAGASINPTTGAFTWTPTAAQIGPHSLTIRVTDTGSPAQFDEETLTVTVGEVNEAPTLTAIGPQTIDEGQLLTFTATASDPDAGQTVTFSLENGTSGLIPAGATINPTTGAFSWTPTELQGSGTYTFDVVVTDNGSPALTDRETITVTVGEVNQAPTLDPIAAQTVTAGQLLSFAAVGNDLDVPANTLTYSLQGTVPAGANINPTTGAFTWTPTVAQIGPQSVTVRVTDNGTPALFAEQVVSITVSSANQAPVAVDDTFTMMEGGSFSGVPFLVKDINPGLAS